MALLHRSRAEGRRGFVIAELVLAVLLLTVAVSSLAALMYSVSRHPAPVEKVECAAKGAKTGECAPPVTKGGGASKLLRSTPGCDPADRSCKDSQQGSESGETVLKPRTDSAALALLAKKQKQTRTVRPDRGFIR
jgi:hypothetical protein